MAPMQSPPGKIHERFHHDRQIQHVPGIPVWAQGARRRHYRTAQALLHAIHDPQGTAAGRSRGDLLAGRTMFSPTRLSRQLQRPPRIGAIDRAMGTCRH